MIVPTMSIAYYRSIHKHLNGLSQKSSKTVEVFKNLLYNKREKE